LRQALDKRPGIEERRQKPGFGEGAEPSGVRCGSTNNAKGTLLAEESSAEGVLSADGGTEKVDVPQRGDRRCGEVGESRG
jgi:hypothetical protein